MRSNNTPEVGDELKTEHLQSHLEVLEIMEELQNDVMTSFNWRKTGLM